MTAIDNWIADLLGAQYSQADQNLISKVANAVAALQLIQGGLAPGGPFLPLAGGTMTGTITGSDGSTWGSSGLVMATGKIITPASVAGIVGTTTNDNAQAGSDGEYISVDLATGSPTALTTTTAKTVLSIPLSAGDWELTYMAGFIFTAATVTTVIGSISATTNTLDTTLGRFAQTNLTVVASNGTEIFAVANRRFSLAAGATIFGVSEAIFSAGTVGGFGNLAARRMR